ncbi:MAG: dihydroneopterin aldolase [SAR202 cluster bacterium]|nr:dihydroneopterin aldolase [SAR202 cluster bacterium]
MPLSKQPDHILLEGMQFYAYHGRNQEERTLGQPFVVDLEAEMDLRRAGDSDDIKDTVNYTNLYHMVREVLEGPPRNLLESLAEAIAQAVLELHPVAAVRVRIKKTKPPIKGAILASAGVEVYRARSSREPRR